MRLMTQECGVGYSRQYGRAAVKVNAKQRTFVDVDTILSRDPMCACCWGMFAIFVVLLGHLLQLVLALAVLCVLVLFSLPRRSVLP